MNIINKRKSKNLISQSDINIISPLGQLESHKILYFQKVNSVNHINTLGAQPIIVYKKSIKSKNQNKKDLNKTTNKNSRYEKINKSESETKVITDGNIERSLRQGTSREPTLLLHGKRRRRHRPQSRCGVSHPMDVRALHGRASGRSSYS